MVSKILAIINREISGVHQAAFLLGFFALLSQILGLARDRLLAHVFGADRLLDIYYTAFRIPDFLFVTIGSLVSMSVLIPFLIEKLGVGKQEARKFISTIFTFFLSAMVVLGSLVFIFMPSLVENLFPGFNQSEVSLTIAMSRIMILSPILLGISNLFGTLTNVYNRFTVYALSPVLYNLGIILGIIAFYPSYGMIGLAFGVVLGAFLHMAIQIPFVKKSEMAPKLIAKPNFKIIKEVAILSVPRTLTLSAQHIATFALVAIATLLPAGSIAIFSLSFALQSVPLSIIGVSYSLAAFPTLAKLYSSNKKEEFESYLLSTAKHIVFWSVPFAVMFIVLRAHIVRVVLGSGQFDWTDTRLTAAVLAMFSFSLVFQSLILLFVRAFYAIGDTKKPFVFAAIGSFIIITSSSALILLFNTNQIFRLFIEDLFKVPDVPGTVVLMLGLGFSLGTIFQGIFLWHSLSRKFENILKSLVATSFEVFSSSVIMGFVTVVSLRFWSDVFSLDRFWGIFGQAFFSGLLGIFFGILMLKILKNREIEEIWQTLHKKFWKTEVVGPDPDVLN